MATNAATEGTPNESGETGGTDGTGGSSGSTADPGRRPLPPGPEGLPLVGNAIPFVRDPFGFYETIAAHGDVVRWGIPGFQYTTLLHPDHVERVLVEEPGTFERYLADDFGFDFAPDGLLLTDGDQWRRQRLAMQPAFSIDRIRTYADSMTDYADRLADTWTDGETVALNESFADFSLRVLSKTLFDLDVDPSTDDAVVGRAARAINRKADVTSLAAFLPSWLPTRTNQRYRRAMRDYRARVDELVAERRADDSAGDDLLSLLLHAEGPDGETLSEAEVRDNLLTFLFAGHEATSLGLTYTFLLLAQHDDAMARLRDELDSVIGGRLPAFADVPELQYTDRVIRESMRLHPPAHVLFRRATEDTVIGGYRIPEGTILSLPQFHVHLDDRFYDDPEAFRPDRWTDEREADRPEYAYFPFGGGPRHCIGMRFATLEMQLAVAVLAQRFDFELLSDPNPAVAAGATHRPKEDVRVRVHERTPE